MERRKLESQSHDAAMGDEVMNRMGKGMERNLRRVNDQ